jgi:hypothetical protein
MKSRGKIFIAAVLSFFVIAVAVPSEARRGHAGNRGYSSRHGHYKAGGTHRSRHGHYKTGRTHRYRHGRYKSGRTHRYRYGHYKSVRKNHYRRGYYGHGAKHRYGYNRHHYRSKHYRPKGYYRHGFYGRYGYGKYGYYRYPFGHRYYYRPYPANLYYYNTYQDDYRDSSDETGSDGSIDYQGDYELGWNLLREDRPAEAVQAFGHYAQANPSEGMPKVGYALALADLGRLDKGIRAMRRALQENPEALAYVAIDGKLRWKVERAKGRYEQSDQFSGNDPGGSFMLAALHYLLDDMDAAQKAMERNIDSYDTSTSAKNLKRLIEEETQVP